MLIALHSLFTYLALGLTAFFFAAIAFRMLFAKRFYPDLYEAGGTRRIARGGIALLAGVWLTLIILDQWIGGAL